MTRRGGGRQGASGRTVIGLHPVRELLRAGAEVRWVAVAETRGSSDVLDEILDLAAKAAIPVDAVGRAELDRQAEGATHQGVVATAAPFPYADLDRVLARARSAGESPLLVVLDGVTDPHNLGSVARTAEAVGAHAIIIPERRAASVTPSVEKAAAGALAHLPVVQVTNLVRTLRSLEDHGLWSVGLEAGVSDTIFDAALLDEDVALIVGAEGRGLARLTKQACDLLVSLPMHGRVGSLNASVAAAVALYEVTRRRSMHPPA